MSGTGFLESVIKQAEYYKMLGEKAMGQLPDEGYYWQPNAESNSIATIVKHLWGNMISRWTDFLTSDGEKEWRDRDSEFEEEEKDVDRVWKRWHEGWNLYLSTLRSLTEHDLETIIYIRNQGHSVMEAINRQMAHYPYHVGQIVYIAKAVSTHWQTLSIPRGRSNEFNVEKFAQPKQKVHFTEEFLHKLDEEG